MHCIAAEKNRSLMDGKQRKNPKFAFTGKTNRWIGQNDIQVVILALRHKLLKYLTVLSLKILDMKAEH